jgi:hypothetical protein
MVCDKPLTRVGKSIINSCVFLAPTFAAEGGKFSVLAEKTLAVEVGNERLMPDTHNKFSLSSLSFLL